MRLLIREHAELMIVGHEGSTPLHLAAKFNHRSVSVPFSFPGRRPFIGFCFFFPPPHCRQVVDMLLSALGDRSAAAVVVKDDYGQTPLHCAAMRGHFDCVQALLAVPQDINVTDLSLLTPLHGAAHKGSAQTVQLLLQRGANMLAKDANDAFALHHACVTVRTASLGDMSRQLVVDFSSFFGAGCRGTPQWWR